MTNINFPNHWITAELVGAPPYLQRAAKDYAEAYALAALAQSGEPEAQPARVVDALRERLAQETGDDDDFASGLRSGLRIALDLLSTPTAAPTLSIKREEREALSKPATDLLTRSASGMGEYIREQGRLRAALPVVPLCTAPTPSQAAPCKGMNCGCTDGVNHSLECQAEHAAAIAGGTFVKQAVTELVLKTIGELLRNAMAQAVENGANSVSMPDEYVAVAMWLAAYAKKAGA